MIRRPLEDQRGMALVIGVLASTLVLAIALALALTTSMEVGIAANYATAQDALYAADAALERTLAELLAATDWNPVLQGLQTSCCIDGPTGTPRALGDGSSIEPAALANIANCAHAAPCSAAELDAFTPDRPWGPNNPRWQLYAHGPLSTFTGSVSNSPMYIVVLIADDPSEQDSNPAVDSPQGNPGGGIIFVRAAAYSAGGTQATVEMTLLRTDPSERVRVTSWRTIR